MDTRGLGAIVWEYGVVNLYECLDRHGGRGDSKLVRGIFCLRSGYSFSSFRPRRPPPALSDIALSASVSLITATRRRVLLSLSLSDSLGQWGRRSNPRQSRYTPGFSLIGNSHTASLFFLGVSNTIFKSITNTN